MFSFLLVQNMVDHKAFFGFNLINIVTGGFYSPVTAYIFQKGKAAFYYNDDNTHNQ